MLTAAIGFLLPHSSLHFFAFLISGGVIPGYLSYLASPASSIISFPDTVHACNKMSASSLAWQAFHSHTALACTCPSHFLNFQPPIPFGSRMNLQLVVLPDTQ